MEKSLSERKKKVLKALVEIYIETGVPVSSGDIQLRYLPDVSSATIRAELSALEALGYVEQPHTSAGRTPLPEAFRVYVSDMEGNGNALSDAETNYLRNEFSTRINEVEDISKEAAKIISDMTNYTSVFVQKSVPNIIIEEVKLVKLNGAKAVVIVSTDSGVIANSAVDVPEDMKTEYIDTASHVLNKVFQGKRLSEIEDYSERISDEVGEFRNLFDAVLAIVQRFFAEKQDKVFVEGTLKMLDYPECDVEDAKDFLKVISDESRVHDLVENEDADVDVTVKVGKEESGVENCAVVTASYRVNGNVVGQAGVIGPKRMDYKKVFDVLEYMKNALSTLVQDRRDGGKDER